MGTHYIFVEWMNESTFLLDWSLPLHLLPPYGTSFTISHLVQHPSIFTGLLAYSCTPSNPSLTKLPEWSLKKHRSGHNLPPVSCLQWFFYFSQRNSSFPVFEAPTPWPRPSNVACFQVWTEDLSGHAEWLQGYTEMAFNPIATKACLFTSLPSFQKLYRERLASTSL